MPAPCGSSPGSGARPNHPPGRIPIGVFPVASFHRHYRLLEALQEIFFVNFRPCRTEEIGAFRFALLWGATDELVVRAQQLGVRCLVFSPGERQHSTCSESIVAFANVPEIDVAIRGQCFAEKQPLEIASIAAHTGEVLATRSGYPIWIRRRGCGAAPVDYVAVEPCALDPGRLLREYLRPQSVSLLMPLLHYVREAAAERNWDSGPRHACFIVDDPSLYRPSYGCVNFSRLAWHATQHRYHIAIATIPLDTWWVHHEVASVFRNHPKEMSLIIHGNDHTRLEMSRDGSMAHALSVLAQALRRFSRLETQHGLRFSRVFEAPHGFISSEWFGPLVNLGYEAALYTPWQFIDGNRNNGWPASLASSPVDVSPQGLCMIPRLTMSMDWRAEVSIAAFLRQPIVLTGHHQDFLKGLELLSEFSTCVNALGNVRWANLSEIARSRFTSRWDGPVWVIRLGARAVECCVPPGVAQVVIERPWSVDENEPMKIFGLTETGDPLWRTAGAVSEPLPWPREAGGKLRIESPPRVAVSHESIAHPPKRIWPVTRKILVETRDRIYPLAPGVFQRLWSKDGSLNGDGCK
jgi:hypothetical protein